MERPKGTIALMGSGELTATMVQVHKDLLARLGPSPRAVFLDTPAGFQLNADQIARRAVEFFRRHVGHPLSVASFRSAQAASTPEAARAFRALREADYVLVGPGSPTYALRQWKDSPVPEILAERIAGGACLVAASAAALTVGRLTLPVYEIYKVGEDPHWVKGLDLLGRFGLPLVVVPHWNNAEGGTHDTRFCYMGEPRFQALEAMLPGDVSVLGLDEHTACVLDLAEDRFEVRGLGRVTLRAAGAEQVFGPGESRPLALLRGGSGGWGVPPRPGPVARAEARRDPFWHRVRELERAFENALEENDPGTATNAVLTLDAVIWEAHAGLRSEADIAEAREVLREMIVLLGARLEGLPPSREACLAPLVEAVLSVRARLRADRRWAEADALREALLRAGVVVEDTPEGTRWRVGPGGGRA